MRHSTHPGSHAADGAVAAFVAYGRELERLVRDQVLPGPAARAVR